MGHTNSTANLSLPQFIGTDKPTWLGDVNGAFSAIDGYVGTNDAAVAAAASDASSAISQAAAAVNTANTANTTAGNASTAATAAVTAANQANALSNQVALRTGVLSDLTTTDKTSIVNAINEVNGKDAGDIAYDNTGSGLTATNVQDAIDEVAQGGGGGTALKYVDETLTSVSIDSNCYTSVTPTTVPAGATILFATIAGWSTASSYSAAGVLNAFYSIDNGQIYVKAFTAALYPQGFKNHQKKESNASAEI